MPPENKYPWMPGGAQPNGNDAQNGYRPSDPQGTPPYVPPPMSIPGQAPVGASLPLPEVPASNAMPPRPSAFAEPPAPQSSIPPVPMPPPSPPRPPVATTPEAVPPAYSQQPPAPFAQTAVQPGFAPNPAAPAIAAPRQRPAAKNAKKLLLGSLIALLAVALVGALALLVVTLSRHPSTQQSAAAAGQKLHAMTQGGRQPQAAAVAKLDKTAAFYAVVQTAVQQPVVQTQSEVYFAQKAGAGKSDSSVYDTAVNYRSKQFAYSQDEYGSAGQQTPDEDRCVDGKQYHLSSAAGAAWAPAGGDFSKCSLAAATPYLGDGLMPGGLDKQQAAAFVDALAADTGFVRVNALTLAAHEGRQYLRFAVDFTPVQQKDKSYTGLQNLMTAFQAATKQRPAQWPYAYSGAPSGGASVVYYADPATLLPVYADYWTSPALSSNGKPGAGEYQRRRVQYDFTRTLPTFTLNAATPITLGWPPEQ